MPQFPLHFPAREGSPWEGQRQPIASRCDNYNYKWPRLLPQRITKRHQGGAHTPGTGGDRGLRGLKIPRRGDDHRRASGAWVERTPQN